MLNDKNYWRVTGREVVARLAHFPEAATRKNHDGTPHALTGSVRNKTKKVAEALN